MNALHLVTVIFKVPYQVEGTALEEGIRFLMVHIQGGMFSMPRLFLHFKVHKLRMMKLSPEVFML